MILEQNPYYTNENIRQSILKVIRKTFITNVYYYTLALFTNGYIIANTNQGAYSLGLSGLPQFYIVFDGIVPFSIQFIIPIQVTKNPLNGNLWNYSAVGEIALSSNNPNDPHCYLLKYPYTTPESVSCTLSQSTVTTESGSSVNAVFYQSGSTLQNTYSGDWILDAIATWFNLTSYVPNGNTSVTVSNLVLPNGSTYSPSSSYNPSIYVLQTYLPLIYPTTNALPSNLYGVVRAHLIFTRFISLNQTVINNAGNAISYFGNIANPRPIDVNIHGNPNTGVNVTVVRAGGESETITCNKLWLNDHFLIITPLGAITKGGFCIDINNTPHIIDTSSYLFSSNTFVHTYLYASYSMNGYNYITYQPLSNSVLKSTLNAPNVYVPTVGKIKNGNVSKVVVSQNGTYIDHAVALSDVNLYNEFHNSYDAQNTTPIIGVGEISAGGAIGSLSALLSMLIFGIVTTVK
ncbi:VP1,2 transmembrane domain protein [Sulfolobus ellipsoid virus 1]|uniref:VP1,2 transmembrane domain protein n=1 Tax=Sulfolobus ellipsoid virus 1 TaxID=2056194 RepID=A0A2H4RBR6_9VIRU|nr:VP1,2 transmembrane domain protein [Sulfolobus ellipsoid virus 1]ATY46498.1 VP1,2 transmembrane domain protein [Sulfolobus ellipsoid virus 1]